MQEILFTIIVGIITLAIGWVSGGYWHQRLITELKKENIEQKEMLKKSIKLIGDLKKQTEPSGWEKYIKQLAIYGAKEWGKKKIDEWLYPDEFE